MSEAYRRIPTETLLRAVAVARAGGDWTAARAEWEACVARAVPRVRAVVSRHYSGEDAEGVVQNAVMRGLTKLVTNLDRIDENTFFASMVTAARYQCLDDLRKEGARRRHEAGSLDAPATWADGEAGDRGAYDKELAAAGHERAERADEIRAARELLERCMRLVSDPRAARIIELDRRGHADAEIAASLGISVANVQTIRSRAYKELRGRIDR